MPKLTVITTLFNCDNFIEESMRSVIDQTYSDFEWIVLNDGSTDKTWDIANSFKDSRIKFVDSVENQRIPKRRNQCINLAKTKYVCIHDGDDISLPNRFKRQIDYLESSANLFVCGGWAIAIDSEGEQKEIMNYPTIKHDQIVNQFLVKKQNPMIDPTTMFKREDFLNLGGYTLEKEIYTVPDMDLWSRAILEEKTFANIPEPLIKYRINPDGMTRKHKQEMINAHMIVWKRFKQSYINKFNVSEGAVL